MARESAALIPLHAFVEGDTLGIVVLVHADDTIAELARRALSAARIRVAGPARVDVLHQGRALPSTQTIEGAGVTALDRVDVRGAR